MGIPGLWPFLHPYATCTTLSELGLRFWDANESGVRGCRIGIDTSMIMAMCIIMVNPKEPGKPPPRLTPDKTLLILNNFHAFLVSLLSSSPFILPLFIFDGPSRPLKRGATDPTSYRFAGNVETGVKAILDGWGVEWRDAKGEAEYELGLWAREKWIDVVWSGDGDAFLPTPPQLLRLPLSFPPLLSLDMHASTKSSLSHSTLNLSTTRLQLYSRASMPISKPDLIFLAMVLGGDYDDGIIDWDRVESHSPPSYIASGEGEEEGQNRWRKRRRKSPTGDLVKMLVGVGRSDYPYFERLEDDLMSLDCPLAKDADLKGEKENQHDRKDFATALLSLHSLSQLTLAPQLSAATSPVSPSLLQHHRKRWVRHFSALLSPQLTDNQQAFKRPITPIPLLPLPNSFPSFKVLDLYLHPATSTLPGIRQDLPTFLQPSIESIWSMLRNVLGWNMAELDGAAASTTTGVFRSGATNGVGIKDIMRALAVRWIRREGLRRELLEEEGGWESLKEVERGGGEWVNIQIAKSTQASKIGGHSFGSTKAAETKFGGKVIAPRKKADVYAKVKAEVEVQIDVRSWRNEVYRWIREEGYLEHVGVIDLDAEEDIGGVELLLDKRVVDWLKL